MGPNKDLYSKYINPCENTPISDTDSYQGFK